MKLTPFLTLIERECYRFGRMAAQTIVPPVITTLLFILIFGYSLGSRIAGISGQSYILYILPGLVGMAVMTNAYSNSSGSLFMARIDRSIENILVVPISHLRLVVALCLGGIIRGVLVGIVSLGVACWMTDLQIRFFLATFLQLLLISATFSSLGILSALWADSWDQLGTFSNFIITPFLYLGGVFYSVRMLPPVWQQVSFLNPMFYFIDGFRHAILGVSDLGMAASFSITLLFSLASLGVAVWLFRRGYKLIV